MAEQLTWYARLQVVCMGVAGWSGLPGLGLIWESPCPLASAAANAKRPRSSSIIFLFQVSFPCQAMSEGPVRMFEHRNMIPFAAGALAGWEKGGGGGRGLCVGDAGLEGQELEGQGLDQRRREEVKDSERIQHGDSRTAGADLCCDETLKKVECHHCDDAGVKSNDRLGACPRASLESLNPQLLHDDHTDGSQLSKPSKMHAHKSLTLLFG